MGRLVVLKPAQSKLKYPTIEGIFYVFMGKTLWIALIEIPHRETYNDFACLRFKPSLTWTKASKILMFKSHLQWLLLKGPGLLQANQAPAAMLCCLVETRVNQT